MRVQVLLCILGLATATITDLGVAASGNHAPRLHHPKGLTVDRKSLGAQSLKMPPGYIAGGAPATPIKVQSPSLLTLRSGHDSANHVPLLNHPKGLTADRKSQGAQSLSMPPGFVAPPQWTPKMAARASSDGPITSIAPTTDDVLEKPSWFARFFSRQEKFQPPARVTAWDIDIEKTAVKSKDQLPPPPQHLGALFSHAGIPPHLRGQAKKEEGSMAKLIRLITFS